MIAEPIVYSVMNNDDVSKLIRDHFDISSEPIFNVLYLSEHSVSLQLTTSFGHAAFSISDYDHNGGRKVYDVGSGLVLSKEDFLYYMTENYPEYLEWFLFHPEWL